ncbi:MAG: hypothetical protein DHS20C11_08570 [Lysobacteraceae bacterium]|nr:MAG: hypothetical protein DHS20C11_08570 [Xanthomonadaceae bacterium]
MIKTVATAIVIAAQSTTWAGPPPVYSDATSSSGLLEFTMAPGLGGGVAAADYDDDGDIDVFVPTDQGTAHQLYKNQTSEGLSPLFLEVAAETGLDSLALGRGAVWLDANSDQRLDLLIAGDCFQSDCIAGTTLLHLFQQQPDGTFVDVTLQSGLFDDASKATPHWQRAGVTAGDIDQDGDPDLYMTSWRGGAQLYRNDNGVFVDISDSSGAGLATTFAFGAWQSLIHDFDRDGQRDIFVAIDFAEDQLMLQNAGLFNDVAPAAGLDRAWNGMGIAQGDVDNDGDFDLYVTNISDTWPDGEVRHSTFYRNDSTDSAQLFTEMSHAAGIDNAFWGWGATFLDANNDMLLDLAVTNGYYTWTDPSRLFLNIGGDSIAFSDAADATGFNDTDWGSGLIAFDADRDGDLDLMQACVDGPLRLMLNGFNEPAHWLTVRPRLLNGARPLDAIVRVTAGAITQSRVISAGTSFMSQEPAESHFGLASATGADVVTIEWPDGRVTHYRDLNSNQTITLTPPVFVGNFEATAN